MAFFFKSNKIWDVRTLGCMESGPSIRPSVRRGGLRDRIFLTSFCLKVFLS